MYFSLALLNQVFYQLLRAPYKTRLGGDTEPILFFTFSHHLLQC